MHVAASELKILLSAPSVSLCCNNFDHVHVFRVEIKLSYLPLLNSDVFITIFTSAVQKNTFQFSLARFSADYQI